tara:strand:+ start:28 stop:858 length:831 start_codon:yes stop_codon:yes gene_type:complete
MNKKTLLTLAILSAGCAFSTTTLAGPQHGDLKQRLCIKLEDAAPTDLTVLTDQWFQDTKSGEAFNRSGNDEFHIDKGDIGIHCSEVNLQGRIRGEGKVYFKFQVRERDDSVDIDSIDSYSRFHGGGANNLWDLNEQDRCNNDENRPGVHLYNKDKNNIDYFDCKEHDGIPDLFETTVYFTPDLSNVDDGGSGSDGNPSPYDEYYGAEQYPWPESWNYVHGDRVWQPLTEEVYQCEQEGWCNQDPNAYSPGTGWAETDANPDNNAWILVPREDWEEE